MTLMMTTENLCMLIRIKKAMEEVIIEVEAEAVATAVQGGGNGTGER